MQQRELKQQATFKATPIRCKLNAEAPERVKSEKKPTVAVEMSLASQERSAKRKLFEQVKREKHIEMEKQEEEETRKKLEMDEEEVRQIRE